MKNMYKHKTSGNIMIVVGVTDDKVYARYPDVVVAHTSTFYRDSFKEQFDKMEDQKSSL